MSQVISQVISQAISQVISQVISQRNLHLLTSTMKGEREIVPYPGEKANTTKTRARCAKTEVEPPYALAELA